MATVVFVDFVELAMILLVAVANVAALIRSHLLVAERFPLQSSAPLGGRVEGCSAEQV